MANGGKYAIGEILSGEIIPLASLPPVLASMYIAKKVYQPTSVLLRCLAETKLTVRCLDTAHFLFDVFQHCHRHYNIMNTCSLFESIRS